ncbi:PWI domain-containing protein [Mycena kentingensis (nom. inval.)]|nr:PWI domain-containing protein [Mycena kentingensis (nom. inval.)]
MADAGFFKGTSADQDRRFADKEQKLLKSTKFPSNFSEKVDMRKVNLTVIQPWITKKIVELCGFEDDILIGYAIELLEESATPDPRKMQLSLQAFLAMDAPKFMSALWSLLLEAQNEVTGVPRTFVEQKKEEMRRARENDGRVTGGADVAEAGTMVVDAPEEGMGMTMGVVAEGIAVGEDEAEVPLVALARERPQAATPTALHPDVAALPPATTTSIAHALHLLAAVEPQHPTQRVLPARALHHLIAVDPARALVRLPLREGTPAGAAADETVAVHLPDAAACRAAAADLSLLRVAATAMLPSALVRGSLFLVAVARHQTVIKGQAEASRRASRWNEGEPPVSEEPSPTPPTSADLARRESELKEKALRNKVIRTRKTS